MDDIILVKYCIIDQDNKFIALDKVIYHEGFLIAQKEGVPELLEKKKMLEEMYPEDKFKLIKLIGIEYNE